MKPPVWNQLLVDVEREFPACSAKGAKLTPDQVEQLQAVENANDNFQVSTLHWVAAIARAIARDVDTGGGADVPVLADLAKYFDDSGATCLDAAFDQLKKIAALVPAPRSAQLENVARESGVSSHES